MFQAGTDGPVAKVSLQLEKVGTPAGDVHVTMHSAGVPLDNAIDHPARRCVTIRDPDGLRLQFYVDRDWSPNCIGKVTAQDAPHLL